MTLSRGAVSAVISLAREFARANSPARNAERSSRSIRGAALAVMGAFACFVAIFGLGSEDLSAAGWSFRQLLPAGMVGLLMVAVIRWPLEGAVVLSVLGLLLASAAWITYRLGLERYMRASILLCSTFLASGALLFLSIWAIGKSDEMVPKAEEDSKNSCRRSELR